MTSYESELESRVQSGDAEALGKYLLEIQPQLTAFIHRRLGDTLRRKVEPDDIFQEVSIEAVRSLPQTEMQDRKPFSWLCQIAEHKIVDAHRHHFEAQKRDAGREVALNQQADNTRGAEFVNLLIASMTSPSQAFSRNVKQARLAMAIEQLEETTRQALHLRYVEGLPTKEIASQLGKSDASIRVLLSRAVQRLQTDLAVDP